MKEISVLIFATFPVLWIIGEIKNKRLLRRLSGGMSILMAVIVTLAITEFERLNYNAWYGSAMSHLIKTSIAQLESGNDETVLSMWKELDRLYMPTYETKGNLDVLTELVVEKHQSVGQEGSN